jgi:hypothetical protein
MSNSKNIEHLSEEELLAHLKLAHKAVEIGAVYAHYRDPKSRYKVIGLSIIEATQEVGVMYQKTFGSEDLKSIVWIRPLSSWLENVSVDGKMIQRFQKVRDA